VSWAWTVLIWSGLAAGIFPASWFLIVFRPSGGPRSGPAFAVRALVLVAWILYARVAILLAMRGWTPRLDGWWDGLVSGGLALLGGGTLMWVLRSFLRYRAAWEQALESRGGDGDG
jgi:hypothetical protein